MTLSPLPITADCWYLTGPTASGKTAVGIELAQRLGAEIISLDSMALYRGMDIGTAKPSVAERGGVPHHLLDILDPCEEYSLAQYVEAAERAVSEIRARGRLPLFVGGTPLYLKALLRGIFVGPPADWELRRRWQAVAREQGTERLHAQLAEVDPQSARRLHPHDTRRIVRALEVWEKTGVTMSTQQQQFHRARAADDCHVFVLDWPRPQLHQRIDTRVDAMFASGLVEEVRDLVHRAAGLSRTASQAVGYREVLEHLDGTRDLAATTELVQLRTRQFAKRQSTWFRSLSECRLVPADRGVTASQIAGQVAGG
jgi:tRNA dimethylallyltransferase